MNTPHPPPPAPVQVVPFIAESVPDAVAQIRAKLGPDAVVVNVRQLQADGLAKLWKSPRIEVLAYKPDAQATAADAGPDPIAELKMELQAIRRQLGPSSDFDPADNQYPAPHASNVDSGISNRMISSAASLGTSADAGNTGQRRWRVGEVLQTSGLLPVHVQRVIDRIQTQHGEIPPASLAEELVMARAALAGLWKGTPDSSKNTRGPHVLVGPAGVGKTTCICKWLAQARLIEEQSAHVWRLDAATANTAESLSIYCEILGVSAERTMEDPAVGLDYDLNFIDLPGVDWRSSSAVQELKRRLDELGSPKVHLVLNAAYEVPLLLAQARAFAVLPVEDLILTHLDEEPRWGKIWNVVLGTNYPVRFLSAAQNVPGEFHSATSERILTRQFPS